MQTTCDPGLPPTPGPWWLRAAIQGFLLLRLGLGLSGPCGSWGCGDCSPFKSNPLSCVTLGGAGDCPCSFAFSSCFGTGFSPWLTIADSLIPRPGAPQPCSHIPQRCILWEKLQYWKLEKTWNQTPVLSFTSALGMWLNLTEPPFLKEKVRVILFLPASLNL